MEERKPFLRDSAALRVLTGTAVGGMCS